MESVRYEWGGVELPQLGLWLDPHVPRLGSERVFISHAHADHLGDHREVILSAGTAQLMHARMGGQRIEHVLDFGANQDFEGYRITLLPAGHVLGSAMAWIESASGSLLYTGDFKLRAGASSEQCEPRPADILIMETTYGLPHYSFPPTDEVLRGVVRFCQEALDNDEKPILFGYSLGKSQELLSRLAGAGLPIMLHKTIFDLTKVYEKLGRTFPSYQAYDIRRASGHVLIMPMATAGSGWLKRLGKTRQAALTGWAVDPSCRFRYQADAAFALSDHADFPELLRLVDLVKPKRIYTLHGFAAQFAETLRERGHDARPLTEPEQLGLGLDLPPAQIGTTSRSRRVPDRSQPTEETKPVSVEVESEAEPGRTLPLSSRLFLGFAEACAAVSKERSKLAKVRLVAEYLKTLPSDQLKPATLWFTGAPFAGSEGIVLQLGWALLRDALCAVGGVSEADIHNVYLKHSDLGETAFDIFAAQPPVTRASLTLEEISQAFHELAEARGPTRKLPLLVRLLSRCRPLEAKFVVKIVTGDLRIGLKEGLVEEAVAQAFQVEAEAIREANLLLGNIGRTAELASLGTLAEATLVPFQPLKFMLASPELTAEAVWTRMEERRGEEGLWLEDKFDGIRCQLHKVGRRAELYSRDLKRISISFPEIIDAALELPNDVILDGEILGMRGDVVLPFAELQKRLARREADLFMGVKIPVALMAFDLLWAEGKSLLKTPLRERRAELERLLPAQGMVRRVPRMFVSLAEDITLAFAAARQRGNEGLMVKDPASFYSPGRRGLAWIKFKQALATLDCVVVGVEYGHGKRKDVLSDYTFAVRDEATGQLRTIGKAYSGLTDAEIAELTDHFLARAAEQQGRFFTVEPDVVLEIAFDRVQPSTRHNSGLALRFPRIVQWRKDKTPKEIDTVQTAQRFVDRS